MGQFAPKCPGQFAPKQWVSLRRNGVVSFIIISRYDTQQEVNQQLAHFGKITAPIPDRIDFQRINTFQTPLSVLPVIIPVFEKIYNDYLKTELL